MYFRIGRWSLWIKLQSVNVGKFRERLSKILMFELKISFEQKSLAAAAKVRRLLWEAMSTSSNLNTEKIAPARTDGIQLQAPQSLANALIWTNSPIVIERG